MSGAGNWDTSSINWTNNSGVPTNFITGDQVRFDETYITAPTKVDILAATVQPASVTVSNATYNYTITNGTISGAGRLLKDGAGTLTLADVTRSYTGGTVISNGTLVIASSTASTLTGLSGASSGTLQVGGSGNILTISGSTANFEGAINVTAGNTLKAGGNNTLGTTNATTTIASGAVYDVSGFANQGPKIIVSGSGIGGTGAIINTGGQCPERV